MGRLGLCQELDVDLLTDFHPPRFGEDLVHHHLVVGLLVGQAASDHDRPALRRAEAQVAHHGDLDDRRRLLLSGTRRAQEPTETAHRPGGNADAWQRADLVDLASLVVGEACPEVLLVHRRDLRWTERHGQLRDFCILEEPVEHAGGAPGRGPRGERQASHQAGHDGQDDRRRTEAVEQPPRA